MENFRRLFRNFFGIFYNFFGIFCNFLENFPKNFCNFFRLLRFPYDFSRKFFRKFSPTIRYGSTGVSPYCKFTSKFTPKFTPILIKILQSTKFEGSHFYRYYWVFITFCLSLKPSYPLSALCAPFPSPPRFPNRSSAMPKVPTAVPPLATSEVCGQYEGL